MDPLVNSNKHARCPSHTKHTPLHNIQISTDILCENVYGFNNPVLHLCVHLYVCTSCGIHDSSPYEPVCFDESVCVYVCGQADECVACVSSESWQLPL